MKMSTKILLFTTVMIILSVGMTSGLVMIENSSYNHKVSYDRVAAATSNLKSAIQDQLTESQKNAVSIAQNYKLIDAMENGNFDAMKAVLDDLNATLLTSTISITDPNGNVMIRQHQPEKRGDSILKQTNVQKALLGETSTTLEPGALVKLSSRTGTPVKNPDGEIIGTAVTGYTFDNAELLDHLKEMLSTDLTIYSGTESIATTITSNDKRAVGVTLGEGIAKAVLEQGKPYAGSEQINGVTYITRYEPLSDTSGKIVGAIFAGLPETEAQASTTRTFFHLLVFMPLVVLVCALILLWFVQGQIKKPMLKLTNVSNLLANGQLTVDIDVQSGRKDEIAMLANAMQKMVANLHTYISDISVVLNAMANNDFTTGSSGDYVGDFLPIKEALSGISTSLNHTLTLVNDSVVQYHVNAEQLSSSAQQLAQGSSEQTEAILELSDAVSKISEGADYNVQNVRLAMEYVGEASASIEKGNEHMGQMLHAMEDIKTASSEINKIIKTIEDIAFQTNLLALNASVEAARAGTAGRGFAVVADEVRNLAAKSAEASKQTAGLISNAIAAVKQGYLLADGTARAFSEVSAKTGMVESTILAIDQSSTKQADEISHITAGLKQISDVVQMNMAASEETAATGEELLSQAELLRTQLSGFILA